MALWQRCLAPAQPARVFALGLCLSRPCAHRRPWSGLVALPRRRLSPRRMRLLRAASNAPECNQDKTNKHPSLFAHHLLCILFTTRPVTRLVTGISLRAFRLRAFRLLLRLLLLGLSGGVSDGIRLAAPAAQVMLALRADPSCMRRLSLIAAFVTTPARRVAPVNGLSR